MIHALVAQVGESLLADPPRQSVQMQQAQRSPRETDFKFLVFQIHPHHFCIRSVRSICHLHHRLRVFTVFVVKPSQLYSALDVGYI